MTHQNKLQSGQYVFGQTVTVSKMRKLYFAFGGGEKGAAQCLRDLNVPKFDETCHIRDVFFDYPDHRLLKNPKKRTWVLTRSTGSKPFEDDNYQTRLLETMFKVVVPRSSVGTNDSSQRQIAIDVDVYKPTDQPVQRLLLSTLPLSARHKALPVQFFVSALLTNVFAVIDYQRWTVKKVKLGTDTLCSLTLDVCKSPFFPGEYCVGAFSIARDECSDSVSFVEMLPPRLRSQVKYADVQSKVLHSLLFTNPYIFCRVKLGRSPSIHACDISRIEHAIQNVVRSLALYGNSVVHDSSMIEEGKRKLQILQVLRHTAQQQLGGSSHTMPLILHSMGEPNDAFKKLKESTWGEHHLPACVRHWKCFYSHAEKKKWS
jgi:hypothetical protein